MRKVFKLVLSKKKHNIGHISENITTHKKYSKLNFVDTNQTMVRCNDEKNKTTKNE